MKDFAMDLARQFGYISWRTLYASVSSVSIIEWEKHFLKHGFTHHNDDRRHGILCASNVNAIYGSAGIKLDTPASPEDYIINRPEQTEQTEEELMAAGLAAGGLRFECTNC